MMDEQAQPKALQREAPELTNARKALVNWWVDNVKFAKEHFKSTFTQMDDDGRFAFGYQWPNDPTTRRQPDRYIVNVTLRHIQQKTASLYAKNPRWLAKRRERMNYTVWDGSARTLMEAQAAMQAIQQLTPQAVPGAAAMGPPPGLAPQVDPGMGQIPPGINPGMPGLEPGLDQTGQTSPAPMPPGGMIDPAQNFADPMAPPMMGHNGGPPMTMGQDPMGAMQALQQAVTSPQLMAALEATPGATPMDIIADAVKSRVVIQQTERLGKTLELLFKYNVEEQAQPFKNMMKMTVRRALTTGVGYVKLGFQRVLGKSPDIESRIKDVTEQLNKLERLAADRADNEFDENDKRAEELRLLIQELQGSPDDAVVREGLTLDYPQSTAIIPDPKLVQLRNFVGCDWVAEEHLLSVDEIKEIYDVDVGKDARQYNRADRAMDVSRYTERYLSNGGVSKDEFGKDAPCCVVWEIYSRKDGLVYHICDGYPDFLREPAAPEFYTERFWPWFPLVFNETVFPENPYPPSDVWLIRHAQMEINRSREGLMEHRFANRPAWAAAKGALDTEDLEALRDRPRNAIVNLNGLQLGQKVTDLLQPLPVNPIDPNLYDTNPPFEDILRAVGSQEAQLGGTGGATATETSIAEAARSTANGSNVDDLDELLTELAKAGGQILLLNVSEPIVKDIVGPGAFWPDMNRADVAREVLLEIEAGSSGRPNQAREVQNIKELFPLLMQMPGISPEFLVREILKRYDDRLDPSEAYAAGLPSVTMMNSGKPPATSALPGQQGPAGAQGTGQAPKPPAPDSQDPGGGVPESGPPSGLQP